jgi:hypothetical protein
MAIDVSTPAMVLTKVPIFKSFAPLKSNNAAQKANI